MTSAAKHAKRSHRSHKNTLPAQMFANKASVKANSKALKEQGNAIRGFFQELIHRMQNK